MVEAQETLQQAIERLGLSIRAEFVPFSKSRNAKPDAKPAERSLNWRVTLVRRHNMGEGDALDSRFVDILTTDYSAGIAHCPAHKRLGWNPRWTLENAALIEAETETGLPHKKGWGGMTLPVPIGPRKKIEPEAASVIHSLALDSDVLDYPTFEEWAENFGYDSDSRKAEAIYRACLEIALKLRAGLGEKALADLRAAAQEY